MEKLSRFEQIFLTFMATFIVVSKELFDLPVHVPGHSGIYWMFFLVVGKSLVEKSSAGTFMGLISGLLSVLFSLGKFGPFNFLKYLLPGMVLDILFFLKLRRGWEGALAGAVSNLSKLGVNLIVGSTLGIPLNFLMIGIIPSISTSVIFGALGGALGVEVANRVRRYYQRMS